MNRFLIAAYQALWVTIVCFQSVGFYFFATVLRCSCPVGALPSLRGTDVTPVTILIFLGCNYTDTAVSACAEEDNGVFEHLVSL